MKRLHLSRAQWLFLALTVVVVVPAVAFLAIPAEVELRLIKHFELPSLQRSLGFQSGYISPPQSGKVGGPVFVITAVTPGGAFARAGVRPGDIPAGYTHGFEKGFLVDLSSGKRAGVVELRLVSMASAAQGDWTSHRVTVRYP